MLYCSTVAATDYAYVANYGSGADSVSIIDTSNPSGPVTPVNVGQGPYAITMTIRQKSPAPTPAAALINAVQKYSPFYPEKGRL